MTQIGVLSVQGAFAEHQQAFQQALDPRPEDGSVVQVRRPEQLYDLDGIVLPGGESTTIDKLLDSSGLRDPLVEAISEGLATLATCAGAILLSSQGDEEVERTDTELLGVLDAEVERNAFGRQRESFEGAVQAQPLGEEPFPGVFIRAPAFRRVWGRAEPFARLPDGNVVGVEQANVLALTFHPELSGDPRLHEHFLDVFVDG